jgi:hypothetical protein
MGALPLRRRLQNFWRAKGRLALFSAVLALRAWPRRGIRPVVFFHASTRLDGLSLNAGFSLIAAWAARLAGAPVVHFVCRAGMSRCVLGADPDRPQQPPPCKLCLRQSYFQAPGARTRFFAYRRDEALAQALDPLSVEQLAAFTCRAPEDWRLGTETVPLGALVLPSVRWRLRLHNLPEDESTRFLFRQFLLSAWNVLREFQALLDRLDPQTVVLFNGQFFPEAVARWLALRRGIRVVTHEVGLQPLSGYFTTGEATAYPIAIPDSFDLSPAQNARLDAYLEQRFQGRFSMAGVQFWPEMRGLDAAFLEKAAAFRQIVPVFTNVIFDTSQPHSNVVFSDMFAWLDLVLEVIRAHPETLFRHPRPSRRNPCRQNQPRKRGGLGGGAPGGGAPQPRLHPLRPVPEFLRIDSAFQIRDGLQFDHRPGGVHPGGGGAVRWQGALYAVSDGILPRQRGRIPPDVGNLPASRESRAAARSPSACPALPLLSVVPHLSALRRFSDPLPACAAMCISAPMSLPA